MEGAMNTAKRPDPERNRVAIAGGMRRFVFVWLGQVISLVGSNISSFAIGVSIYQRTGSATWYGLSILAAIGPFIMVSPAAGVLVDRWGSRRALLLANLGAGSCMLALVLLMRDGALPLPQILAAIAGGSAFTALEFPALSTLTMREVAKTQLGRANGLVQLGFALGQILGPWGGGLLLSGIGLVGILWVDVATFLAAALVVAAVPLEQPLTPYGARAAAPLLRVADMVRGFQFIRERPGLLEILLLIAATNFNLGILQVVAAPLVLTFADPSGLGAVLTTGGFGMLAGSGVMVVWGGPRRQVQSLLGFLAVQSFFLVLASLSRSLGLVALGAFGVLFTIPVINGCSQTVWQRQVPLDLQGRVFAVRAMLARAVVPFANVMGGLLMDRLVHTGGSDVGVARRGGILLATLGLLTLVGASIGWCRRDLRALDH